ncbi:MAG: SAM hydroxide adenosyltransferase [Candidatus Paceibacterota bacterium]|jgi:hypothetical protein
MQITIINDCQDQNAKLRQVTRAGSYFKNASVNCFGVSSELEAAGFLLDAIDAFEGREGIVLANVAPRNGSAHKWKNGTPFGYFWYKKTLVVTTIDGMILSLAKKYGVIDKLYVLEIKEVLEAIKRSELSDEVKGRIISSQFRSYDFLPRAAYWIKKKIKLPKTEFDLNLIPEIPKKIWFTDNFGNAKTTIDSASADDRKRITVRINGNAVELNYYKCLRDLKDGETGLVQGSSGVFGHRFLEIMTQGKNTSHLLNIKAGDDVEIL